MSTSNPTVEMGVDLKVADVETGKIVVADAVSSEIRGGHKFSMSGVQTDERIADVYAAVQRLLAARIVLLTLLCVLPLAAQSDSRARCEVVVRTVDGQTLVRKQSKWPFRFPVADPRRPALCEDYTFGVGWAMPMRLHLGGAAPEFLPVIRDAVAAWNRVFAIDVIELQEDGPVYEVGPFILDDHEDFYADGVSVLYFDPQRREADASGSAHPVIAPAAIGPWREEEPGNLLEVDVFIWDAWQYRELPADHDFVLLHLLLLHELGHVLGLAHNPVSASVMSYSEDAQLRRLFEPLIVLGALGEDFPLEADYTDDDFDQWLVSGHPYGARLRRLLRPQAQDTTLLMCHNDFDTWQLGIFPASGEDTGSEDDAP